MYALSLSKSLPMRLTAAPFAHAQLAAFNARVAERHKKQQRANEGQRSRHGAHQSRARTRTMLHHVAR